MKRDTGPGRRALRVLVAAIWILGGGLLLAEGVLPVLGLPFQGTLTPSENAIAQFDAELGWSYIPNRTTVAMFGRAAPVTVHVNGIGARVSAPGREADPAAPSVVLAGCSFTFGHGLPYEKTLAGWLEASAGLPYQVVNLGVQGYGTDQAFLMLRRRLPGLNAKVVVYTYMHDHLWRNANYDRRVFLPRGRFVGTKPLFGLAWDGTPVLERAPCLYEDYRYSRVLASLERARYLYGPPPGPALTRALVLEMKKLVEARGARLLVVHWRWSTRQKGDDDSLPFAGLDLDLIDTRDGAPPDFQAWRIRGDGHPDARAHRHVAGAILARLIS